MSTYYEYTVFSVPYQFCWVPLLLSSDPYDIYITRTRPLLPMPVLCAYEGLKPTKIEINIRIDISKCWGCIILSITLPWYLKKNLSDSSSITSNIQYTFLWGHRHKIKWVEIYTSSGKKTKRIMTIMTKPRAGLEPATPTLGKLCSTIEPPRLQYRFRRLYTMYIMV